MQPAATLARDTNPVVSPDGRWIVFASSRGRPLDETSLWIARLEPEATPVPLTSDTWIAGPGSARAGSAAEGRGGVIAGPGSARAGSAAEGRGGIVIAGPGSARAGSAAEGRGGIVFAGPGSARAGSAAEGRGGIVIDAHPAWTPDGAALVWASTRGGHGFDLWRAPLELGGARPRLGEPVALTTAAGHEVTPSVATDGAIVYAAVTDLGGGRIASRIEERAADGSIRALTTGTTDSSPALSPDGARVVFARPVARGSLVDSDLWITSRGGGEASVLVDLPLTDESGPVWSRDGRYVLATSLLRGADGRAVFSSVIVIDTREPRPIARLLADRAGPITRLTPAIATATLDEAALHADPEYLPELARILAKPMIEAKGTRAPASP